MIVFVIIILCFGAVTSVYMYFVLLIFDSVLALTL